MPNIVRCILLFSVLIPTREAFSQSNYEEALEMIYDFRAKKTLDFFEKLQSDDLYSYEAHVGLTWYYLQKGQSSDARKWAEYNRLMFPSRAETWFLLGHTYVLDDELDKAKEQYSRGAQIADEEDKVNFYKGINVYINSGIFIDRFDQVKAWADANINNQIAGLTAQLTAFEEVKPLFEQGNISAAKDRIRQIVKLLTPLDMEIAAEFWAVSANYFFEFGMPEQAYDWVEEAYAWAVKNNLAEINGHYFSSFSLFMAQTAFADDPLEATKYIDPITKPVGPSTIYMQLEGYKLACEVAMRTTLDIDQYAFRFKNLAAEHKQNRFLAEAYNYIGKAKLVSDEENGFLMAKAYFLEGVRAARLAEDEEMATNILGNYALALWANGNRAEAINTYRELIDKFKSEGKYLEATTDISNLGLFLIVQERFAEAAKTLEEGIDIAEKKRNELTGEDRQALLAGEISTYGALMLAYAHLNDAEALFNIMQKQRARSLRDYMTGSDEMLSLSAFQQILAPDEAAIFYNNALEGEIVALVVTNTEAKVNYHKDENILADLRKKYDIRQLVDNEQTRGFKKLKEEVSQAAEKSYFAPSVDLKQERPTNIQFVVELYRQILQQYQPEYDPLYKEFSNALSDFLIRPIQTYAGSKSKWLISASWELNFVPFETLLVSNQPLVSTKDIRYILSADVAKLVGERQYSAKRKPLLAMGGARYGRMAELDRYAASNTSMFAIKRTMDKNITANKHQREVFASLGFGQMNYLPGTLAEVNAIEKIVSGTKKITDTEMSETQIKEMASKGELQKYKVIHLATHGYSLEMLPELSGVAMTIFENPQNGEDGYLTAYEMMKLNMNADLVVLSACETGLGKLVGGEGVNGLTRALTIGGANRTLVSLWPVSDEGTMLFMTAFYDLIENKGQSYTEAVNSVKRAFIAGEFGQQFNNPNIWAPFITYGN